jgi:hypothetical protein
MIARIKVVLELHAIWACQLQAKSQATCTNALGKDPQQGSESSKHLDLMFEDQKHGHCILFQNEWHLVPVSAQTGCVIQRGIKEASLDVVRERVEHHVQTRNTTDVANNLDH